VLSANFPRDGIRDLVAHVRALVAMLIAVTQALGFGAGVVTRTLIALAGLP
jgi:hypothetical protein